MSKSLFSYVVRSDAGFAPNPFFGYCTLATCKPRIRNVARCGDWIVGTGSHTKSVRRGGYLVYAMRVTEVLSTPTYWSDSRFQHKKPNIDHGWLRVAASGDNIYKFHQNTWRQLPSYHSHEDGTQNEELTKKDTSVPTSSRVTCLCILEVKDLCFRPNFVGVEN